MKKPDERIFLRTTELLGLKPQECIYVDDRRFNLDAAKALGMEPIIFGDGDMECDYTRVSGFAELKKLLVD